MRHNEKSSSFAHLIEQFPLSNMRCERRRSNSQNKGIAIRNVNFMMFQKFCNLNEKSIIEFGTSRCCDSASHLPQKRVCKIKSLFLSQIDVLSKRSDRDTKSRAEKKTSQSSSFRSGAGGLNHVGLHRFHFFICLLNHLTLKE